MTVRVTMILLLLSVFNPLQSAFAKAPSHNLWTFNLHFENDVFSNTDHDYTNGFKLSWVSPDLTDDANGSGLGGSD